MKQTLPIAFLIGIIMFAGFVMAAKPEQKNSIITETLDTNAPGLFDLMSAAIERAGLESELSSGGAYTVLAPIDPAFMELFNTTDEAAALDMIANYEVAELSVLVKNHIIKGNRSNNSLMNAQQYTTLNGTKLTKDDLLTAGVIAKDWDASNGVIHVLDNVIVLESAASQDGKVEEVIE